MASAKKYSQIPLEAVHSTTHVPADAPMSETDAERTKVYRQYIKNNNAAIMNWYGGTGAVRVAVSLAFLITIGVLAAAKGRGLEAYFPATIASDLVYDTYRAGAWGPLFPFLLTSAVLGLIQVLLWIPAFFHEVEESMMTHGYNGFQSILSLIYNISAILLIANISGIQTWGSLLPLVALTGGAVVGYDFLFQYDSADYFTKNGGIPQWNAYIMGWAAMVVGWVEIWIYAGQSMVHFGFSATSLDQSVGLAIFFVVTLATIADVFYMIFRGIRFCNETAKYGDTQTPIVLQYRDGEGRVLHVPANVAVDGGLVRNGRVGAPGSELTPSWFYFFHNAESFFICVQAVRDILFITVPLVGVSIYKLL